MLVHNFKLNEHKITDSLEEVLEAIKDQYDRAHPGSSSSGSKGNSGSKKGK